MKIIWLALIVAFIPVLSCYGQTEEPAIRISKKLEQYHNTLPNEKVHLHTDKSLYSVGDTIWFSAYIVNAEKNELSALSKVLYVNLVNRRDSVCTKVIVEIKNGLGNAHIVLKPDLPAGNYRLQAYTNWMRNMENHYMFSKEISIGNVLNNHLLAKAAFTVDQAREELQTTLSYTDLQGRSHSYKEVNYVVSGNGRIIKQAKGMTDENGRLVIDVNTKRTDDTLTISTTVDVNNTQDKHTFYYHPASALNDIRFFPESGNLVEGIRSLVGIKATGTDGLGINLKGVISDQDGNRAAEFTTAHAGMGSFAFTPQKGKVYSALVQFENGTGMSVPLPKTQPSGYVLAVNSVTDTANIIATVKFSDDLARGVKLTLLAQQNGSVRFAAAARLEGNAYTVPIPRSKFNSGIIHFTLFDELLHPLAQRLAFIQSKDSLTLNVNYKSNYLPREEVSISVDLTGGLRAPAAGAFSVSVVNNSVVGSREDTETSIYTSLLLNSDLRGYIERPNYYFITGSRLRELDNLMLTQGWVRFTWDNLLNTDPPRPMYHSEKGFTLSGSVKTFGNKPLPASKLKLYGKSKDFSFLADTVSDAQGVFRFTDLPVNDTTYIFVKAERPTKNLNLVLSADEQNPGWVLPAYPQLDRFGNDPSTVTYLRKTAEYYKELETSGSLERGYTLKEVTITGARVSPIPGSALIPVTPKPAVTLKKDQLQGGSSIVTLLQRAGLSVINNRIFGFDRGVRGEMQIYLNSQPFPQEGLQSISPASLEGIEVIRGGSEATAYGRLYGGSSGFGVVLLTMTKTTYYEPSSYTLNTRIVGYSPPADFYLPKYDVAKATTKDLRSTIYWNPNVITDAGGKFDLKFFNGDSKGNYKMVIEGLASNGRLTRKVIYYNVN